MFWVIAQMAHIMAQHTNNAEGSTRIRKTFVKNLPIMHYPCLLRIINTLENNHLSQATPFDIMSEQRCRTNYCHGGADMWATPSRARNALRSDTNTLSTGLARGGVSGRAMFSNTFIWKLFLSMGAA